MQTGQRVQNMQQRQTMRGVPQHVTHTARSGLVLTKGYLDGGKNLGEIFPSPIFFPPFTTQCNHGETPSAFIYKDAIGVLPHGSTPCQAGEPFFESLSRQ